MALFTDVGNVLKAMFKYHPEAFRVVLKLTIKMLGFHSLLRNACNLYK